MFFENDEELDYEEGDETIENEISKVSNENVDFSDKEDNCLEKETKKVERQRFAKEVDGTRKEENREREKKVCKTAEEKEKREDVKQIPSKNKKRYKKNNCNNRKSEFFNRMPKRHSKMFRGSGFGSNISSLRFKKGNVMSTPLKYINHQPFSNCFNGYSTNNQLSFPLRQNLSNEQQLLSSFWSRPNLLHQNNFSNFQKNLLSLETLFPSVSFPELQLAGRFPPVQQQFGILYEQPPANTLVNNNFKTDPNILFQNVKKKNPFDQQETATLSMAPSLFGITGGLGTDFSQSNQHSLSNACPEMDESEKSMVNIKKQARLQRFMNEDGIKNIPHDTINACRKKVILNRDNIPPTDTKKLLVESKRQIGKTLNGTEKREGIFSLNPTNVERLNKTLGNSQLTIPTLRKEVFNKKKNPFETGELELVQIKDEKTEEYQSELSVAKTNKTGTTKQNSMLNRSNLSCNNCNDTKVTFVRTISKSFEELGCFKTPTENSTLTQKQTELETSLLKESFLTGCIVKVLNISKTTTTKDILELCNPVGKVLEIKLNVPKENSAVIRFAKSEYAEDFYALYHGQKYCDNFLNVIIV